MSITSQARVLVVQHQDDCPPAMVGDWLAEEGCRLDVRHPYAGEELPTDLDGHDALVVLGGSMGAHDDDAHAWLAPVKELVRRAAAGATPTLGICLGHQLVAVALGGASSPNPRGQQLGVVPLGWRAAAAGDPLASALSGAEVGMQWNDDVVSRMPEGAEVLAATPYDEVQVARFAPTVWGVQAHPEADASIAAAWASQDEGRYEQAVLDEVLARIGAAQQRLVEGWRPLATRLAVLARDGVPAPIR